MKRSRWTVLFCATALLLCCAMPVGAFEIGARAMYWFPGFKTDMKGSGSGLSGTDLNLKDNLGVGTEGIPTIEVFGGLGRHNLSLAYTPIKYTGSTTPSAAINFNGQTFAAGTNVDTTLRMRMVDLEYQITLINMENLLAGFSVGAIGKVKYIDGEAKLSQPGKEGTNSFQLPLPMVGIGSHIGLLAGILEARAKLTGIGYSNNYLYEGLADISLTPFPFLDIHAGYKIIRMHIDQKDLLLDSQLTGPYVGLTVSF